MVRNSKKLIWCKKMVAIMIAVIVFGVEGLTAQAEIVTVVNGITKVSANTSDTSSQYSAHWEYWCHGASQYSGMRRGGCRVTAFAKLIKEAGYAEFANPDKFLVWGISNGFFQSTSSVLELGTFGKAIETYISQRNGNCTLIATNMLSNTSTDITNMMKYIKQGYYIVLSSSEHTAYVGRAASIAHGTPVILDSWGSASVNPASTHTYTGSYDSLAKVNFAKYHVYSVTKKNTDTIAPVISNIKIKDVTNEGYIVTCKATDNIGMKCVTFNDYLGTDCFDTSSVLVDSGNTYRHKVDASKAGVYTTEIIAYDTAGNSSLQTVTVDIGTEEQDKESQQKVCKHTSTKSTKTKATTSKNGKVVKKCTACNKVISTTTIHKISSIKLDTATYTYNGKVIKPSVTVKNAKGTKLKNGSDYTVSYAKGRKSVGKYNVKITFKGKYKGLKTLTFTIKPNATSIKKLTAKSKGFEIRWKKQNKQTTGYQIQYSTKSNFKGDTTKTITIKKNSTVNKSVSKLSAKKKYYVRIRTYKTVTVNGKRSKIYSDWSNAKTVTTKK